MKTLRLLPIGMVACCLLSACLDDDSREEADTQWGNFMACWRAMDEHYCFFDEKGVDWDEVYLKYRPLFADSTLNVLQQFNYMGDMLAEVRDGHVNMYSSFNTARYWSWYEDYLDNYDDGLLMNYYLGTKYWTISGMKYGLFSDSVGYLRYESFATTPGETNLDYALSALRMAKGLIIDIRNNGGGALTNVPRIANRFASEKTCYGYICHKTGRGHNDFSEPEAIYLEPPTGQRVLWDAAKAPVVVLTNRHTFSAANNFIAAMRALDGTGGKIIKMVGDKSGGGGGMPFSTVLPNGWIVRFSACPILDHRKRQTEEGLEPDLRVDMDSAHAYELHRDDIIEAGRTYILQHSLMSGNESAVYTLP